MKGRSRFAFWLVWAFVLTLPWENSLLLGGIGTISRTVGMVALSVAALAVLIAGRVRRPHLVHLLALLFVCWGMLTFLWSENPDLTLTRLRTTWQLLLLLWLVWEFTPEEGAAASLMQAYVLGAYVSVVNTAFDYVTRRGDLAARYMAVGFNPNELGMLLVLGIPFAYYLALTSPRGWRRWLNYAYVPAAFAAVLLTASRGAFIAALAALLVVPVTLWHTRGWRRASTLLVVGVAVGAAVFFVPKTSWERIGTIGTEVLSGRLNERRDIWQAGLSLVTEHPLVGVGAGAFRTSIEELYGEERVAHNTFLGVLVEQGAVGLALFVAMLVWLVYGTRRLPLLERQVWRLALLSWAIGALVGQWEHRKLTWFLGGLLLAHITARRAVPVPTQTQLVIPLPVRSLRPGAEGVCS